MAYAVEGPGGVGGLAALFGSPGQRALEARLAALVAGRQALSQEIANLDTPGYRGQDVGPFAAALASAVAAELGTAPPQDGAGTVPPVAPAAVPGATAWWPAPVGGTVDTGAAGVVTPDANGMDFDALMVQLAETDLGYQAVARQLQLVYAGLRAAIDAAGGR
jgi:flagellar basal body rod protein FlgB